MVFSALVCRGCGVCTERRTDPPWWSQPGWAVQDPTRAVWRGIPARLPSPQVSDVDLARPAVHVSRGPRQVGKSTDLELIAERALTEGHAPRQVLYLALDLLEAQPAEELTRTIDGPTSSCMGARPRVRCSMRAATRLGRPRGLCGRASRACAERQAPASAGPSTAAVIVSGSVIRIAPFSSSRRRASTIVIPTSSPPAS